MADDMRARRATTRRITRSTTAKGAARAGKAGKAFRVAGLKAVDTIPRLQEKDFEDGESKALDRLVEGHLAEGFTGAGFADDLQRTLGFVKELGAKAQSSGTALQAGLHEECERLLKEEVAKARFLDALRKGAPKA